MFDLFISHSGKDKINFVEPLVNELTKYGRNVWYDKHSLNKGDKVREEIISGISESVIFMAVLSNHYFESNWANMELGIFQTQYTDNFLPIILGDAKEIIGQKYPFILNCNYIEYSGTIKDIAIEINELIMKKRQERGLIYIEKTNLDSLIKKMYSYNNFSLDQIAIRLSRINKQLSNNLIPALIETKDMIELILNRVAQYEGVILHSNKSVIDFFLEIDFIGDNLKEHIKYLRNETEKITSSCHKAVTRQDDLYLVQFSIYSITEWYMITYFKKPIIKPKKLIPVAPEEFTEKDILEAYKIETLVLPPDLIASPDTDMEWFRYNPLTMIGARDIDTEKLVGFFTTLPVSDLIFEQIKKGDFDDTRFGIKDIRQYDMPGFYKLYLCSFCIHPAYNTSAAFKIIYTSFIDFLLWLASEYEIYISEIVADGVTLKGANLCEKIGMKKIASTVHNTTVYYASLIPPEYTTLKLNNVSGHKLITYYEKKYNEYRDIF